MKIVRDRLISLVLAGILLCSWVYFLPASFASEQEMLLKVAGIKSFLQEYDPQDINANNTEELKTALAQMTNVYGIFLDGQDLDEAASKNTFLKIYERKDSDLLRFSAFFNLIANYDRGYDRGRMLNKKETLALLEEGIKDANSIIRAWSAMKLADYKWLMDMPEDEFQKAYGASRVIDDLDKQALASLEAALKEDPVIARYVEYYADLIKKTGSGNELEYYSRVLKDSDKGVRFITLLTISLQRLGASIVDLPTFALVVNAAEDPDPLIRLFSLSLLRKEDKFAARENKLFSESLESFFREIKEVDLYSFFPEFAVSIEAIPEKDALVRIVTDASVVKRALLFGLLRNSISTY